MTAAATAIVPVGPEVHTSARVLESLYGRDATNNDVLVLDGHGLRVSVERGHLILADGIGSRRRLRRLSRAHRTVRRITVLGHTGHVTLDAIRWCADVGIALVHLDTDGDVLAVAGGKDHNDPRLRRAQALAADNATGLAITVGLLTAKLEGQAAVVNENLHAREAADTIASLAVQMRSAADVQHCRELEAAAANIYFGAWSGRVAARYASRDVAQIPAHWHTFTARRSPLLTGRTARKAADPINALLNYGYALGELECVLALRAVGLDPGVGIVHTDKRHRDSLALDLLEVLRPDIDRRVLQLLAGRHLPASDFHETPDGTCRLLAPLTHELAADLPFYARVVAPHAEAIAHALASSHDAPVQRRTPLTGANARTGRLRPATPKPAATPSPAERLLPSCRTCGVLLTSSRRKLCPTCWPATRVALKTERAAKAVAERARRKEAGEADPTQTAAARAKRHSSLVAHRAAEAAWEQQHPAASSDPAWYREHVLPALSGVPLSRLQQATALSVSACSGIRSGKLVPHARHWPALAQAGALPSVAVADSSELPAAGNP